jgi:hypothetical protein
MDLSYFQMLLFFPTVSTNNNSQALAILHEFQRMGVIVVPAAADDDNRVFAGSNIVMSFVKKDRGRGVGAE